MRGRAKVFGYQKRCNFTSLKAADGGVSSAELGKCVLLSGSNLSPWDTG